MKRYLALLRGVNVGGKSMLQMTELKTALEDAGFKDVKTYIRSGNVFFSAPAADTVKLAAQVQAVIYKQFQLNVAVAVFSKEEWVHIAASAPDWWGKNPEWKHNILVLIPPFDMKDVLAALGELKPEVESLMPGEGVLYQSVSFKLFHRTHASKMIGTPVYKQMTIRNYNTATKLAGLFD